MSGGRKHKKKSQSHLTQPLASTPQKNKRYWAGIDPGKNGAVVLLSKDGFEAGYLFRKCLFRNQWEYPRLVELFERVAEFEPESVIEIQHPVSRQGLKSTFVTGFGYGVLIGCLNCIGIRYTEIRAKAWKEVIKEKTDDTKKDAINTAYALFPELSIATKAKHSGLADAACMALYARRLSNGKATD